MLQRLLRGQGHLLKMSQVLFELSVILDTRGRQTLAPNIEPDPRILINTHEIALPQYFIDSSILRMGTHNEFLRDNPLRIYYGIIFEEGVMMRACQGLPLLVAQLLIGGLLRGHGSHLTA